MQLKSIARQVVVGASNGIGRETARSEPGLQSLVDEIEQIGGEAIAVPTQVTVFEREKAIADNALEQ